MADQNAMLRVFADYARTIARRYDISDVLYRVADQVVDVLGVDGAGVSVVTREGKLRFVSATDERVVRIEERQIADNQGPCQDAHALGQVVSSPDLTVEPRWPTYRQEALQQGCTAAAGIPMAVRDHKVGVLTLYSRSPRRWDDDLQPAQILADMATGYILNALILQQSERLAGQLQHALDSRVFVEQAKGVLAERHGLAPAEAFQRLRDRARRSRLSVHELAREVLDGRADL